AAAERRPESLNQPAGYRPPPQEISAISSGAFVPPVEVGQVAGGPGFAEARLGQVPGGTDLSGDLAQVVPQVVERRPTPEPVPVVDPMDDQSRFEHQRVRDHRVV